MEVDSQVATVTHYCKFPSCTNEARSSVGRYAYCSEHQDRAARGLPSADSPKPARTSEVTLAAKIASLASEARKVDAAFAKAKKLAERALAAKKDADELQRELQQKLTEASQ